MRDFVIYQYQSVLRAAKIQLDRDDQTLLADLPQLALRGTATTFAETLLDLLRLHPRFATVARACLVRRRGMANQIEVLSSANVDARIANTMTQGYSCYVGHQGSMFCLSPGVLRIYRDAGQIVGAFASQGREPQRSIARVASMGFRSGVFVPSFDTKRRLAGGFFLNFQDSQGVLTSESDFVLLSAIESLARGVILGERRFSYDDIEIASDDWWGRPFDPQILQRCVDAVRPASQVTCHKPSESFLVSHGNLACILGHLSAMTGRDDLAIDISRVHNVVSLAVAGVRLAAGEERRLRMIAAEGGYELTSTPTGIDLCTSFEPANVGASFYSIESSSTEQAAASATAAMALHAAKSAVDADCPEALREGAAEQKLVLVAATYATQYFGVEELSAFKQHFAARAQHLDITGMALHSSGIFLHLLEGRREQLQTLVREWRRGPGLGSVRYMHCSAIDESLFTGWHLQTEASHGVDNALINELLSVSNSAAKDLAGTWMRLLRRYLTRA